MFRKKISDFCLKMITVFLLALILIAIMALGEMTPERLAWLRPMARTGFIGLVVSVILYVVV
jgi:hypothetical protein